MGVLFPPAQPRPAGLSEGVWVLGPPDHIVLDHRKIHFTAKGVEEWAWVYEIRSLYLIPKHPGHLPPQNNRVAL